MKVNLNLLASESSFACQWAFICMRMSLHLHAKGPYICMQMKVALALPQYANLLMGFTAFTKQTLDHWSVSSHT